MRVAVVGLGAAGLYAAKLLRAQGVHVIGLEARDRLGGRIKTFEQNFELGAEWIDADHPILLSCLESAGLELIDDRNGERFWDFRGEFVSDRSLWPDARQALQDVHHEATRLSASLCREPWMNHDSASLDEESLGGWLDRFGFSTRARWAVESVYRSDEGDDTDRVGLLGWLAAYKDYVDRPDDAMSAFRVKGGLTRLVDHWSATSAFEVRTRWKLESVQETDASVILRTNTDSVTADFAIITAPPSISSTIRFFPPLEEAQMSAFKAARMARIRKVVFEFDQPWWLDQGWSGHAYSDGPCVQIWDGSVSSRHALTAYITGGDSRLSPADPVFRDILIDSMPWSEIARKHLIGMQHQCWTTDRWSKGGFMVFGPGFALKSEELRKQHGRVHFAGEHTALRAGFVEGALESAERVAKELLSR